MRQLKGTWGYRQHHDKTFIGKTKKGFDWMGIQFNRSGIGGVAPRLMANHRQRLRWFYEHTLRYGKEKTRARVVEYVRKWKIWRKYMIRLNMTSTGTMNRTLATLLLIALVGAPWAASAATVPSCGSESWVSGNGGNTANPIRMISNGPPGVPVPPGAPVGVLQNSGTNIMKTCRMPAGTTRFFFGFGMLGANFGTTLRFQYLSRVGIGAYESHLPVPSNPYPGAQLRTRLGGATLTCLGADGTRTANFPSDAVAALPNGEEISVPCQNREDGTVIISINVQPQEALASLNYAEPPVSDVSGIGSSGGKAKGISFLLGGAVGPGNTRGEWDNNELTSTLKSSLLSTSNTLIGKQSCNVHWISSGSENLSVDFGTIGTGDVPETPGQPFLNVVPVDLGLVSECTTSKNYVGTLNTHIQIVGVSTGTTGLLSSDNPGVEFEFRNKSGGERIPVNVMRADGTSITFPTPNQATINWEATVVPVWSGQTLLPGRTRSQATVELWVSGD